VLGQPEHLFPLYLAEAALVELVALFISPRRTLLFGLVCGGLIGTVGLAAEWAWSNVFSIPWPSSLLPEAIFLGFGMALAGSVLGAWLGAHLTVRRFPRTAALRTGAIVSAIAITGMIGYGLIKPAGSPVRATVTTQQAHPGPQRTVNLTVRLQPRDAAKDAELFNTITWQGGGFATHPLQKVAPGVYRTTHPVPVYGSWKTAIRLERGASMDGVPIYLPADSAIPVPAVPATQSFARPFVKEAKLLRREAKDVPAWEWTLGTAIVAVAMMALLFVWALGLRRLADAAPDGREGEPHAPEARTRAPARVKTTA